MSAISASGASEPGSSVRLVGAGPPMRAHRCGWRGRCCASPSRRALARSSSQVVSTPSSISLRARAGDALAVERARAEAARPQRVVGDGDSGGEHCSAEAVLEEAAAARRRHHRRWRRRDGAGGRRRHGAHRRPAPAPWPPCAGRPGGRRAARPPGRCSPAWQIAAVGGQAIFVVALHGGAGAGQDLGTEAMAGAPEGAAKAVAGGKAGAAARPGRRAAIGIRDARHCPCCVLGRGGRGLEAVQRRFAASARSRSGQFVGELARLGQPDPRVLAAAAGPRPPRPRPGRAGWRGRCAWSPSWRRRRPTITRRPISRASLRSSSSSAPSRQDRLRLVRSTRRASAASAPASRAAARMASSRSS